MQGISFTAIDFETANNFRASACAVGMAKVRAGEVVEQVSWLIKPPPGFDDFHPINVGVHGITTRHMRNMPHWGSIYGPMMEFIGADAVVGHNVSFEKSVIAKANEACGLPSPKLEFHCTLQLARRHLELPHYKLSDVGRALGLAAFKHHDAGEDALASANIAITLAKRSGVSTLDALWPAALKTRTSNYSLANPTRKLADLPPANLQANPYGPLFGQTIVFSGDLAGMSRAQAQDAAAAKGATLANRTTKKVTLVVCSDSGDGGAPSGKVKRAHELSAAGQDIRVIDELAFRRLLAFN